MKSISLADVDIRTVSTQLKRIQDKVQQLYSVLMQVTGGEANDIVCNNSADLLEA